MVSSGSSFGDTASNNTLSVNFVYELFTNSSLVQSSFNSILNVIHDIELSVTNLLLPSLFSSCSALYRTSSNNSSRILSAPQVLGISAKPDDMIVYSKCFFFSRSDLIMSFCKASSVGKILGSCEESSLQADENCVVVTARLTLFTTNVPTSSLLVETLLNIIMSGMNDGELATANDAIIRLRWLDLSDKTLLFLPSTSTAQGQSLNSMQRNWPILLGVFIGLLLILAALLWRKKKEKRSFVKLDDDNDIRRLSLSDIQSDIVEPDESLVKIRTLTSVSPTIVRPIDDLLSAENWPSFDALRQGSNITQHNVTEDFLGFLNERNLTKYNWLNGESPSDEVNEEAMDYMNISRSFSGIVTDMVQLRHVNPLVRVQSSDSEIGSSALFNMDDSGRLLDLSLICSICNKSMEGMARKFCACGKGCNLSAHTLCVLEKYPLPSVSHPGTPPTMLPVVLCRYRPRT